MVILRRYARLLGFGLLPWLIVFCVPEIRAQFRLQVDSFFSQDVYSYNGIWNSPASSPWYRLRKKPVERIESEHPGDVRVALLAAEERVANASAEQTSLRRAPSYTSRLLAPYHELIPRFPRESWLLAACIRHSMSGFRDDRVAGSFEDPNSPPLKVPPTSTNKPASFTPAELRRCIEVARLGRKSEPHNSFYDWWLAYFLYVAHRDEESLAVLHQGARKSVYDEHHREEVQARLYCHGLTQTPTAESKANVMASLLVPELAPMRHFARLLAWRSRQEQARGRHDRALRLAMDVTRFSGAMRRQAYLGLGSIVAAGMGLQSWQGITRDLTEQEKKKIRDAPDSQTAETQLRACLAMAYAHRQGSPAAAAFLGQEMNSIVQDRVAIVSWRTQRDNILGLRQDLEKPAITLWLGGQVILWQVVVLLGLSAVLMGLAWPLGMEKAPVSTREVAVSTLLAWLPFPAALAAMYYGGTGWLEIYGERAFCGFLNESSEFGDVAALAAIFVPAVLPAILTVGILRLRRPRAPKVTGAARAELRRRRMAMAWNTLRQGYWEFPDRIKTAATFQSLPRDPKRRGMLTGKEFARVTFLLTLWLFRIATGVSLVLFLLACLDAFGLSSYSAGEYAGILLCELGVWCVIWTLRARWWQVSWRRAEAHRALRRYRGTLFTYLLLCGWVYLALALANLDLRRQSSAEVDAYAQRGERAMMLASKKT